MQLENMVSPSSLDSQENLNPNCNIGHLNTEPWNLEDLVC